jgi:hypothetical protein
MSSAKMKTLTTWSMRKVFKTTISREIQTVTFPNTTAYHSWLTGVPWFEQILRIFANRAARKAVLVRVIHTYFHYGNKFE